MAADKVSTGVVHACTHDQLTVADYANRASLPEGLLHRFGLRDETRNGTTVVRIPYRSRDGVEELAVRYASGFETLPGEAADWKSGSIPTLFGLHAVPTALPKRVVLCTGELDVLTLADHDVPALGLPGPQTWDESWATLFDDVDEVYVVVARRPAGELAVPTWLAESSLRSRARLIGLERGSVHETYLGHRDGFTAAWQAATAAAPTWGELRGEELYAQCGKLAEEEDILEQFDEQLRRSYYAGDTKPARLLYLILLSRVFERPASAVVKGPSSAGKNDLLRRVLRFFRPEAYFERTGLTTKALYYSIESFRHRVLVLFEANNLREGELAGIVRSLLSEGRLVYEFTDFEDRGTRLIDKPGPTGLVTTTTLVSLDRELETRLVSIHIPDTPEQTRAVMLAIAAEEEQRHREEPDYREWQALDEWLGTQPSRARVPFARQLAALVDASAVRMRRDFTTVLAVVRAHALLHQATREKDSDGAVLADPADYRAAWELLSESVAEAAERAVPDTVRELVATAARLLDGSKDESVTIRQLAGELGLDDSAVRRRVYKALDLGYLAEVGRGRGRARLLAPGDALPEDRGALPTPDELIAACTHARTIDGE